MVKAVRYVCCKLRSCNDRRRGDTSDDGERGRLVATEPALGKYWPARLAAVLWVCPLGGHAGDVRFFGGRGALPRNAAGRYPEPGKLPRYCSILRRRRGREAHRRGVAGARGSAAGICYCHEGRPRPLDRRL